MDCLRRERFFVPLLWCLFSLKVTSTQEGSSYFFYQQPKYPRDCKETRDQYSSDNLSGVFTIKPDEYPQSFEVYCSDDTPSGGWMVIQRRIGGSITFNRNWEEYESGFGFLSREFWIGNKKLSYITNQAVYELRIDVMLSNGSSFYVKYNSFRISDEWSQYALVTTDGFIGNSNCVVSTCPFGITHAGCTCQTLCDDPVGMMDCNENCTETCAGCINGVSYINDDCTQNCTCIGNQITCDATCQCSPDATCTVKSGVRKCYCNDDFEGDGETCDRIVSTNFTDCYDVYQSGHTTDGIYTILPTDWPGSAFDVFCNMTFGDGGWTVFQRRTDGVTDFYRYWEHYKQGFGILSEGTDFWLGNEQLHYLTDQKDYILRIDFVHHSNVLYYEEYTTFKIGNESTKYRISYASFKNGNTDIDNNLHSNNGHQFSTRDQDNDECSYHDCAAEHKGGWWYGDTWCQECDRSFPHCYYFETRSNCHNLCTDAHLNGDYNGGNGENVFYNAAGSNYECNHIFAEMKIRPSSP